MQHTVNEFYKTESWKKLRSLVFQIYDRRCFKCGKRYGLVTDHIKPRSQFPWLRLRLDNMQILCRDCDKWKYLSVIDFRSNKDLEALDIYLKDKDICVKALNSKLEAQLPKHYKKKQKPLDVKFAVKKRQGRKQRVKTQKKIARDKIVKLFESRNKSRPILIKR